MCQAYEAERASIVAGEEFASRQGHKAAEEGRDRDPSKDGYHGDSYESRAWLLGYDCFGRDTKPWTDRR